MEAEVFERLLHSLPTSIQAEALRYRNRFNQEQKVVGKHLLIKGLCMLERPASLLNKLKYTKFHRPYIDDTLDFNIAHSGNLTLCAISETDNVGVDIEKKEDIDIGDFKNALSNQEICDILQDSNQHDAFYKLWTQKEAFLKAVGTGLNMPLQDIKIQSGKVSLDGQSWFLQEIEIEKEYVCHLCTSNPSPTLIFKEVSFLNGSEHLS